MRFGRFHPVISAIIIVSLASIVLSVLFRERIGEIRSRARDLTQDSTGEVFKKPTSQSVVDDPSVQGVETSITPTKTLRTVAVGMWVQGFWDDGVKTLYPQRLQTVEVQLGKKMAIAHYYRGWHELNTESFLSTLRAIDSYSWRPMVSANPYFFDLCQGDGLSLYQAIANGNCDAFLREMGRTFARFGKPVFFRFAWEMNIPSMEWEIRKTGSGSSDFINAWRHIHEVMNQEGASNILWVFSPHVLTGQTTSYRDIYPGDAYVDWVALDGYNWGTTQSWSSWQSFRDIFYNSYDSLATLAPGKPLMIAEVNSTDAGGSKEDWYKDMLSVQIPEFFPKIQAIVFYNEDRSTQENVNWLIDTSTDSLSALREGLTIPIYSPSW